LATLRGYSFLLSLQLRIHPLQFWLFHDLQGSKRNLLLFQVELELQDFYLAILESTALPYKDLYAKTLKNPYLEGNSRPKSDKPADPLMLFWFLNLSVDLGYLFRLYNLYIGSKRRITRKIFERALNLRNAPEKRVEE